MLREDRKYTELEARILDLALVLHAEHGGGNNSTFTVHVVSSSGTDTYSAIAAALGSLKGQYVCGIRECRSWHDSCQIYLRISSWPYRTYFKYISTDKWICIQMKSSEVQR